MSEDSSKYNVNSWLEDELYQQYQHDRGTVDPSWRQVFEGNGGAAAPAANGGNGSAYKVLPAAPPAPSLAPAPVITAQPGDQMVPLRGPAARIAENMTSSLTIPTATSQRLIPVKLLEENRRRINDWRTRQGQSKVSFTHLVAWALVKGVESHPVINNAYAESEKEPFRVVRGNVNIGLAIDVAGKDGTRSLKVPNVKAAQTLDFAKFLAAYDDLVQRARTNKLQVPDFEGTTVSLTNPGTVGTVGSIPRLMPGQGAIIATGAIDYPPEYRGVPEETKLSLGIGKVMMITCTYDHRVIQGAESGMFLARLQALLEGEDGFYEKLFDDLGIAVRPASWGALEAVTTAAPLDPMKAAAVERLVNEYRTRGHLSAHLDPLSPAPRPQANLDPGAHGLTVWDLDRKVPVLGGEPRLLRDLIAKLERTYCSTIGVQYMHIEDAGEREWLRQRMEPSENRWALDAATRKRILQALIDAEGFETFLHTRFMGHKRFSSEGGEAVLAILAEMLDRAANAGVQEAVMGMAHRGRLTVLANIVGKSMEQLFGEFDGDIDPDSIAGSGDVKYHLGANGSFLSSQGKAINVSVAFNPSHLEAVNPVVEGLVRPKQNRIGDAAREKVIPVLVHGDAAFAGQGVVAETLNLSQIAGYDTGGTIHIVINNQVGFTANPYEARSSTYCSDVALMIQSPVFHVNGDDPEACVRVAQLALDYRQAFKKDVVIDMVCYRKHGHNEADDPSYTQPRMYAKINAHPSVATLHAQRLQAENVVTAAEVDALKKANRQKLNEIYDRAQQLKQGYEIQEISAVTEEQIEVTPAGTAVPRAALERVVAGITTFPADFHVHPKLKPFLDKRREAAQPGGLVDWACGEALAFGTLLLEGSSVRLSGQDCGRGTFSQRHANYVDYDSTREYKPLANLAPQQGTFEVYDSALSEYAVMGFEFGYSVADPLTLVLWEGQFGDFANGAQIIIDQFLAASDSKWGQPCGLVLLLPHGYEGQGPEHSSARIERFLQLAGEGNIQVANCTTPAQYFHILRRQMRGGKDNRGVRKPLVMFTPKSILRHPKAVSTLDELAAGRFQEILDDAEVRDRSQVTRVLLCSGKIYYDLLAAREQKKAGNVALVRVEQLYPFRESMLREILERYPAAAEVVWVQEEPKNSGAWEHVKGPIRRTLDASGRKLQYAGRLRSASPSAGSMKRHQREQAQIVDDAFATPVPKRSRTRLVRKKKA